MGAVLLKYCLHVQPFILGVLYWRRQIAVYIDAHVVYLYLCDVFSDVRGHHRWLERLHGHSVAQPLYL